STRARRSGRTPRGPSRCSTSSATRTASACSSAWARRSAGLRLLFPTFRFWARGGRVGCLWGGVASHLLSGGGGGWRAPFLAAYMLGFVAWVRRPQAVLLSSRANAAPQEVKV